MSHDEPDSYQFPPAAPPNEGPGEHDRHLLDDDPTDTTPCARCGRYVWAYAQRCHHCGVHFAGEAWQFAPTGQARLPVHRWWPWLVALLILGLLWWVLF